MADTKTVIDVATGTQATVNLTQVDIDERNVMEAQAEIDRAQRLIDNMQAQQRSRLGATDWTQGGDALDALTQAEIDAYAVYRQAVRAINNTYPDGTDNGGDITWPTEPNA